MQPFKFCTREEFMFLEHFYIFFFVIFIKQTLEKYCLVCFFSFLFPTFLSASVLRNYSIYEVETLLVSIGMVGRCADLMSFFMNVHTFGHGSPWFKHLEKKRGINFIIFHISFSNKILMNNNMSYWIMFSNRNEITRMYEPVAMIG